MTTGLETFARMRALHEAGNQPAYPSRHTTAGKRRDVLTLLVAGRPDGVPLTDREIARRAGVSPTTVGAIRRAPERRIAEVRNAARI